MNPKALLIFLAGLVIGGVGYHLIGAQGGEEEKAADVGEGAGLGSMLGTEEDSKAKEETKKKGPSVAMPDGFEDVRSMKDILTKAGPRDRFQALMAYVEGIETHEIEAALAELRANTTNQFDPEAMFAAHLLLMRWGEEDSDGQYC